MASTKRRGKSSGARPGPRAPAASASRAFREGEMSSRLRKLYDEWVEAGRPMRETPR